MSRLRLLLAAAALCVLSACASSSAAAPSATALGTVLAPAQRQQAGSFGGALLTGGRFSGAQVKDKVAVLNFWASWCTPCQTETPQFDSVYRDVKSRGVAFVGVDTRDDRSNARTFVRVNDISFPSIYDEQGQVSLRLGRITAPGLPYTVLLDRRGRIAAVYKQRLSAVDLRRSLNTLLREH